MNDCERQLHLQSPARPSALSLISQMHQSPSETLPFLLYTLGIQFPLAGLVGIVCRLYSAVLWTLWLCKLLCFSLLVIQYDFHKRSRELPITKRIIMKTEMKLKWENRTRWKTKMKNPKWNAKQKTAQRKCYSCSITSVMHMEHTTSYRWHCICEARVKVFSLIVKRQIT